MHRQRFISILILVLLLSTALTSAQASSVQVMVVKDIAPGVSSSFPSHLNVVNGILFFAANDGVHGMELWRSNGTGAGTYQVKDIKPGIEGGLGSEFPPPVFAEMNGILYFTADDGVHGMELWRSNGTETGTYMVKDIYPGGNGSANISGSAPGMVSTGTTVFFNVNDGVNGLELWKTDGTSDGTQLVKDIRAGSDDSYPRNLSTWNGLCVFAAHDGVHGFELWRSDGTVAGTQMIKDVFGNNNSSYPSNMTSAGEVFFFTAEGFTGNYQTGVELYRSDGTEAGTYKVKEINTGLVQGSDPYFLTNNNGILYFTAKDGVHGYELWRSDGTESGTYLVKDLRVGPETSGAGTSGMVVMNGKVYFSASDGTTNGLAVSDGTPEGTFVIKQTGITQWHTLVGGTLFFSADDGVYGEELWMSDGTEAGTVLAADIDTGFGGSDPRYFTDVNGTLFFQAWGPGGVGIELMRVVNGKNMVFLPNVIR